MGMVGGDDTSKVVVTQGMGVGTLAECVGTASTVDAGTHPGQQADREFAVIVIVNGEEWAPWLGLVSVEVDGLCDGKGAVLAKLGVLFEWVGD